MIKDFPKKSEQLRYRPLWLQTITFFLSRRSCSSFWKCFSLSCRALSASSRTRASSSFWKQKSRPGIAYTIAQASPRWSQVAAESEKRSWALLERRVHRPLPQGCFPWGALVLPVSGHDPAPPAPAPQPAFSAAPPSHGPAQLPAFWILPPAVISLQPPFEPILLSFVWKQNEATKMKRS